MKKLIFVALVLLAILITPALTHASIADDIAALQQQIATLQAKLTSLINQQTVSSSCFNFEHNLTGGSRGRDVYELIKIFTVREGLMTTAQNAITIDDSFTLNFNDYVLSDGLTAIVKQFQTKYGIPNTGFVGVLTRAKLNELYGCKTNSGAPVINGISGPTSLKVGETGTWMLRVTDLAKNNLSYSVLWGDEVPQNDSISGLGVASSPGANQTSTFSHAYSRAGTFTPVFYVSNGSGQARSSLTVVVGLGTQSDITVTSPNGGEKWRTYDTEDIKWDWPNAKRTDKVDIYLDVEPPACVRLATNSCLAKLPPPYMLDKNISARATYNWIVATDVDNKLIPAGNYRVRVCQAGTMVCDDSFNYFTIAAPAHLMRICPDEKIINRMPTVGANATNSTYFIMDGVRWELEHFDLDWVTRNCSVKEETVY